MKKKVESHSELHKKAEEISKKALLKDILWIAVILLIFYFSIRLVGTENIHEKVGAAGIFGPLILIFLKASTVIFAPLGGMPIYLAAGTLFGITKGIIYILIGDFIGFTGSFWISRIFGKRIASHFLSKKGMTAVNDVIAHMGSTKGLIQSCFVFIGFPEAISYGAGLSKVAYLKFISIIMVIWIFPVFVVVSLGSFVTGNFSASALVIVNVIIILMVTLGVIWLQSQSKKNKQ